MELLTASEWIDKYCLQPKSKCLGCPHFNEDRTCQSWMDYIYSGIIPTTKHDTKWMRVFKIKRPTDGKFKDKGMNRLFSDRGNTWATRGLVRAHITMNDYYEDLYKDCVIVEYQLEEYGMEKIE